MKCLKVSNACYVLLLLAMMALLTVAAPAYAQTGRSIELEPQQGKIGDSITIAGEGFNTSSGSFDKYAAIFFSDQEATTLQDIDTHVTIYETVKEGVWLDYNGEFQTSFVIPARLTDGVTDRDVTSGTYYIYVCHYQSTNPPVLATRIRAIAAITVTMGEISLSPRMGRTGILVEITGTDFPNRVNLEFKYDDSFVTIESGSTRTGSTGSFLSVFKVPESAFGSHTVTVTAADVEVQAKFTVSPEIEVVPTSGLANTRVAVSGTGFTGGTPINLWFDNSRVATTAATSKGSFMKAFDVPELEAGSYVIEAEGEANLSKANFRIVAPVPAPVPSPTPAPARPNLSISSETGSVGMGLLIGGSGFKPESQVVIEYDGGVISSTLSDRNGVIAAAFSVPRSDYGDHTITASDGTNKEELLFTVESTPPQAPSLISPETGARIVGTFTLDWTDVADDSLPVVYELQIDEGLDFSAGAMILEKKQLSGSAYVVTVEDMSKIQVSETPYYWRVRAIDGASNEGRWSSPGAFIVADAFPGWALYTLIGLGVIVLVAAGFFLNMKISRRKG